MFLTVISMFLTKRSLIIRHYAKCCSYMHNDSCRVASRHCCITPCELGSCRITFSDLNSVQGGGGGWGHLVDVSNMAAYLLWRKEEQHLLVMARFTCFRRQRDGQGFIVVHCFISTLIHDNQTLQTLQRSKCLNMTLSAQIYAAPQRELDFIAADLPIFKLTLQKRASQTVLMNSQDSLILLYSQEPNSLYIVLMFIFRTGNRTTSSRVQSSKLTPTQEGMVHATNQGQRSKVEGLRRLLSLRMRAEELPLITGIVRQFVNKSLSLSLVSQSNFRNFLCYFSKQVRLAQGQLASSVNSAIMQLLILIAR